MFNASEWRTTETPEDLMFAIDSYYSKDDFSGRAAIFEDETALKPLDIDLFIQNIDVNFDEHIQFTPHASDTFGIVCFGKAPMRLIITATLADTQITFGKQYLVDAYKNKLRVTAVSRTGKVPVLKYGNYAISGPFISLKITQNANSEDTLIVVLTMIVTNYQIVGEEEPLIFDYIHGVEDEAISAMQTQTRIINEKTEKEKINKQTEITPKK